jgi:S1-C subfamily serine protease
MVLGSPEEGSSHDDDVVFRAPLPPDDRLWRHPSEIEAPTSPPPAAGARRPPGGLWSVSVVSALIGSVLTFGMIAATGALAPTSSGPAREVVREVVRPTATDTAVGTDGIDVVRIADELSPAIVRIVATGAVSSGGSGVIIRDDGHLITNAHVVDRADQLTVVLSDGSEVDGEIVGMDPQTDIAVVKMTRDEPFVSAPIGTATGLRVGQPTIAIGSPLGLEGGSSVTTGVVSQLGRTVQPRDRPPLLDMVQTDAAIAPGSSGGALIGADGSVVGITTAVAVSEVGAEGLAFAVPIDIAHAVADDIIATGKAVHVWLGIEGISLDSAGADELGVAGGALVQRVVSPSPASEVGLEEGDVIVSVADEEIISMSALVIALRRLDPDDQVELGVVRGGQESSVLVTLAERP